MCHKMWNSNVHHHHHPWVCVVATTRTTWELHCVIEARHFMFGNKKCVINKKREKKFMKNIKKSPNFPRRSTSTMLCGNHNLTLHFFFSAFLVKGKFIKKLFIRDFVSSRFFSSHRRESRELLHVISFSALLTSLSPLFDDHQPIKNGEEEKQWKKCLTNNSMGWKKEAKTRIFQKEVVLFED